MNRLRTLFFLTCGLLAACDGTHKDRAVPDLPDVQASLAFTCAYEKDTIPPRAPEGDQLYPILGSANINDRSLFGERDSDIAVMINDGDTAPDKAGIEQRTELPQDNCLKGVIDAALHFIRVEGHFFLSAQGASGPVDARSPGPMGTMTNIARNPNHVTFAKMLGIGVLSDSLQIAERALADISLQAKTTSTCPLSTASPTATAMRVTLPEQLAMTGTFIFIASSSAMRSPWLTACPSFTAMLATTPPIWAHWSPAPAGALDATGAATGVAALGTGAGT